MSTNATTNLSRKPSPCHLVMVTNTLARGGAEAMLVRLALTLDPQRVRPVVVCLKEPGVWADALAERSIPVYANQLRHKFDVLALGRLSRLVRQYQPACLMAVGSGGDRMFWSTLAGWRTGAPVVVWSHVFPTPGHLGFEWINRRLYSRVNTFVALGQRHRDALTQLEAVPADRLIVIRNGIKIEPFDVPERREPARRELGVDRDDILIGIVANLREDKRHDLFIEAAAKTHEVRNTARFVIIGDGPERAKIERMAKNHDPGGNFLRMLGPREDVATLLQGLDVVCLTSQWQECLSVVMLEAMAASKAFVAPRVGSLDEALIDGVTGRFFEPLTPDALAAVLIELIDDADLRATLGQKAHDKVSAEFAVEQMAREFEVLVSRLCQPPVNDGS